jgi:hypothetical protein
MSAAPISWTEAEPARREREHEAMAALTGELVWRDNLRHRGRMWSGWAGPVPAWAAERAAPLGMDELLADRRLHLFVLYPEGFPMIPPWLVPVNDGGEPLVEPAYRTMHEWHVMGDGSLCLLQTAVDWHPNNTAAELVVEASGWFVEYLLMRDDKIKQMTERGIGVDTSLDEIIASYRP